MSGIYRCPCGQQFKVAVPAGGAKVKCPGCGKLLQLAGNPARKPAPAPAQRAAAAQRAAPATQFPNSAPARQSSSDPLFGNLDVPASPSPSFGAGATFGASTARGGHPFPKTSSAASHAAPQQRKSGKTLLIALAGAGGLLVLCLIVGVIAALVDRSPERAADGAAGLVGGPARAVAASRTPATGEEAKQLAEKFEHEIRKGSPFAANQMVDWQSVVDKGLQDFDISDRERSEFARGAVHGMRQRNWAQMIKTQTRGDVKLLRMRSKAGSPTALFRTKTTDGGIGYFEFVFDRDASEKARIADVYMFQTGEWMSETIHRAAIPFVAHQNRSFMEKLSGQQSDYVKHQKKIETMGRMAHTSPTAAIATYRTLPTTLKNDKTVMILRIGIASKLNDDSEYQAAINDFMSKFPSDPAAQLFAIDYYAMKGQMGETLRALNKLDQQVGGDPALRVLEAKVHVQQGDVPKAKSALQQAIQQDPDYQDAKTMLAQLQ